MISYFLSYLALQFENYIQEYYLTCCQEGVCDGSKGSDPQDPSSNGAWVRQVNHGLDYAFSHARTEVGRVHLVLGGGTAATLGDKLDASNCDLAEGLGKGGERRQEAATCSRVGVNLVVNLGVVGDTS